MFSNTRKRVHTIRLIGFVIILLGGVLAPNAYALFGLPKFSFFKRNTQKGQRQTHAALPGQRVRTFTLQKAKASDLVGLLQNYMDGIKSQGSISSDPAANTITVTDDPEIVARIQTLIKAMDQTYDNPNARAREMLASRQMLKAIRSLAPLESGAGPKAAGSASPSMAARASSQPVGVPVPTSALVYPRPPVSDELTPGLRRIMEEPPPLLGFHVIGWVRDSKGLIIVLHNNGQRYVFRDGRILYGGLGSHDSIPGVTGIVQGEKLILRDQSQRAVSLSMNPRHDKNGDIR